MTTATVTTKTQITVHASVRRAFKVEAADFADCLIAQSASSARCERTVTFGAGAAKVAGMTPVT